MEDEVIAVGIDLGTTYSVVGILLEDGKVKIIPDEDNVNTTPSYVAFTEDDEEPLVGAAAKNQAASNPTNTVFDAKRLIGRSMFDKAVKDDIKHWPFKVEKGDGGKPMIVVQDKGEQKKYSAEEISSKILVKLKDQAESYLHRTVTQAVITVPAYFNNSQRESTKKAATDAGLNVLRIINEPTAAAMAYSLENQAEEEKIVLIFDFGGGTFDVSLLSIEDGGITVKATNGNTHLGGEDIDNVLVNFCREDFKNQTKAIKGGIDIKNNKRAMHRLRTACVKAKESLSFDKSAQIEIEVLADNEDYSYLMQRTKLEELCKDIFEKCMPCVKKVLEDSGQGANQVTKDQVDQIVLVGGSTRIPYVQQMLSEFFDGKALNKGLNPDEAVAQGAAIQAAILSGKGSKEMEMMLLLDVNPLSLGVRLENDIRNIIIEKNTSIPYEQSRIYRTASDNQKSVQVKVYEGEGETVQPKELLGEFILGGIPPALRGCAKINVKFEVDANGILHVTAVNEANGNEEKLTIQKRTGFG